MGSDAARSATSRRGAESLSPRRFANTLAGPATLDSGLGERFSQFWRSPSTSAIDRQRIVRCLVDDVVVEVLDRSERLAVAMRWCGGFQSRHEARRRVQSFCQLDAAKSLAQRIQQLYDEGYPLSEIARLLNAEGYHPAKGKRFTQTGMGALVACCGVRASSPSRPGWFRTSGGLALCAANWESKNQRLAAGENAVGSKSAKSDDGGSTGPTPSNYNGSSGSRLIRRADRSPRRRNWPPQRAICPLILARNRDEIQ